MKKGNTYCPCCGIFNHEVEIGNTFLICPICDWEDDGVQLDNTDYEGGANSRSLNQARQLFKQNQAYADNIIFMSKPSEFEMEDSFVVHISKIKGVEHLFSELYEKLCFPNYFGFNWDALNDCLNDFNWVAERDIIIVHDSSINLSKEDLEIYMDVLCHATISWLSHEEHNVSVVFRTDYKEIIETLLKNNS